MPDPVVSPADTIRAIVERSAVRGYTAWKDEDRGCEVVSLETHEALVEDYLALGDAADPLMAVGERDKAEIEDARYAAAVYEGHVNTLVAENTLLEAQGERDRQQIARLTEALDARPITREHAFRAAQNAVRNQGYAVALHGSQIKDLDLIAVPWQETALTAQDVAELIAAAIPGFIEKGSPDAMPNGRLSFTIRPNWHYGFDHWWIDLAVMPRECDWPARAVLAGEEDAANG